MSTDAVPGRLSTAIWTGGLALIGALLSALLVPLSLGGVAVPVSVVLAAVVVPVLTLWAYRLTDSLLVAAAPPVAWFVAVAPLSLSRPEGDVLVPGTATGLAFLVVGSLAAVGSWLAVYLRHQGRVAAGPVRPGGPGGPAGDRR